MKNDPHIFCPRPYVIDAQCVRQFELFFACSAASTVSYPSSLEDLGCSFGFFLFLQEGKWAEMSLQTVAVTHGRTLRSLLRVP